MPTYSPWFLLLLLSLAPDIETAYRVSDPGPGGAKRNLGERTHDEAGLVQLHGEASLVQRARYHHRHVLAAERTSSANQLVVNDNPNAAVTAVITVHPPKFFYAARFLQRWAACPAAREALNVDIVFSNEQDKALFEKGLENAEPRVPNGLWTPVVASIPASARGDQFVSAWKKWYGLLRLMDKGSSAPEYGLMLDSELLPYNEKDCGADSGWHKLLPRLQAAEASKEWTAARVGTDVTYKVTDDITWSGQEYDQDLIFENAQFVSPGPMDQCEGEGCQEVRRGIDDALFSWWTNLPYVKLDVAKRMLEHVASQKQIQIGKGSNAWQELGQHITFPRFEHIAYQHWCILHEGFHFKDVTDITGQAKWGSYLEDPRPGARIGELQPMWVSGETFTRAESGEIGPMSTEAPPLLVFHVDHAGDRFKDADFKSQWERWQNGPDQPHALLESKQVTESVNMEYAFWLIEDDGSHREAAKSEASLIELGPRIRSRSNPNAAVWLVFIGMVGTAALILALPCLPSSAIGYVVCVIYLVVSVTIDLSIAVQKTSQTETEVSAYHFNPKCAVFLTELIKLVVSLGLAGFNAYKEGKRPDVQLHDATWLLLPAMLFTANNILVYQAIGKNDMAAFGVFRDTMILWTALIWRCFFNTELGWSRLGGIFVIFGGLAINRAGMSAWSWAFLWVLVMTLTNATGSVVNEFALKRSRMLDINVQNSILYVACGTFAILLLAMDEPSRLQSPAAFFQGFTGNTFFTLTLQAFAGLIVSRMLKYADSVTKTVACCLRGPAVVFTAPYLLGVSNSWSGLISAVVVAAGCTIYLLCGPLAAQPAKEMLKDEPGEKLPRAA